MTTPKNLLWFGPPYSYSGYAQHNRAMLFELVKLGWNIQLVPSEAHIPAGLQGKEILLDLIKDKGLDRRSCIALNLVPPPALPYTAGYNILFTTIESRTVHYGFFNRCTLFNELLVPCQMNKDSLVKAGWPKKKVSVIPEGVYTELFNPGVDPHPDYKSDTFTFFYNGDWSYRKGIDVLIRAYAKAFKYNDPVRLLLLVHYQGNGPDLSSQVIPDEIRGMMKKYNIDKLPPIEFIFDFIDDKFMPSIYKCADCYVAPTRGEAWGLPISQALACGIPAVVPNFGGHMQFCDDSCCYLTKLDGFDIFDDKCDLCVDFYKDQLFPFPNVDSFAQGMRKAYDDSALRFKKGLAARRRIADHFTWDKAAKLLDKRLLDIYAQSR